MEEQHSIGEFIAKLRKDKGLIQKELADQLFVSVKAISKWETNRGMPDVDNLHSLSKFFNVSINELLIGHRVKDKSITNKDVDNVINVAMYGTKREYNKKLRASIFLGILAMVVIALTIFFINSYNSIMVYRISSNDEIVTITNGLLIKSKVSNIFSPGSIKINHTNIDLNKKYFVKIYADKSKSATIYEGEFFSNNNQETYGYDDHLSDDDISYVKDKLYMVIIYNNLSGDIIREDVILHINLEFANDKLFYTKGKIVGKKEQHGLPEKLLRNLLEQNDFKISKKDNHEKIIERNDEKFVISINSLARACIIKEETKDNILSFVYNVYGKSTIFENSKNNGSLIGTYYLDKNNYDDSDINPYIDDFNKRELIKNKMDLYSSECEKYLY